MGAIKRFFEKRKREGKRFMGVFRRRAKEFTEQIGRDD